MAIKSDLIENLDGSLTIISHQEDKILQSVAGVNKKDKEAQGRGTYKGDSQFSHHVARIPMIDVEKMMRDKVWGNQDRMKEWLNNPENYMWRTTKGKL
jgi:hypothetical protein